MRGGLDVWQLKELQTRFLGVWQGLSDVWQGKDLRTSHWWVNGRVGLEGTCRRVSGRQSIRQSLSIERRYVGLNGDWSG